MALTLPHSIAHAPLFEPLRGLVLEFDRLPADVAQLNALCGSVPRLPQSGAGMPIQFVSDDGKALSYEERIFETGEIQTRSGSWHDFFNALVWLAFPRAKAALNARHYRSLQAQRAAGERERGPARDAATQFDESGAVLVASDASLLDLLREHRWKELFWERRSDFVQNARVIVFGHATYDQLRAPFTGLCAKTVLLEVAATSLAQPLKRLTERVDKELARRFERDDALTTPRNLRPLPLLGIPGVAPENTQASYYDDARQFRHARQAAR